MKNVLHYFDATSISFNTLTIHYVQLIIISPTRNKTSYNIHCSFLEEYGTYITVNNAEVKCSHLSLYVPIFNNCNIKVKKKERNIYIYSSEGI